ncbi:hypothetical protein V1288_004310 [Bradyrhizobium sp. AZCC 2176]
MRDPDLTLLAAALWSAPSPTQSRNQLGPLCTADTTPTDQQINARNKSIALKVFSGEKLASIYFWRAVSSNKKGNYTQVIADASEAIRPQPSVAAYNLRGSAGYDKGEYDIATADFQRRAAHRAAIRDFLCEAARSQFAVGHGIPVDGRNYLVPIDTRFQADNGMTDTMMDMDTIRSAPTS